MVTSTVRNLFGKEGAINGDMLSNIVSLQNLMTGDVPQHYEISLHLELSPPENSKQWHKKRGMRTLNRHMSY